MALALIACVYGAYRLSDLKPIFVGTIGESGMLLMIIGMSLLYSYVMSYLHISQAAAQAIVDLHLSKWLLLTAILGLVVVLGFFLPPVSIILMTAPIILPPLKAAGFDLIWFGVVMAVVMEMGLIHPPVGLNIFVINRIAPDIGLGPVIRGTIPFVVLMAVAVVILSFFPSIAMWLPNIVYG
jgi:TRAP-type C4-dicarboxylate transport system permease large subunit